MWKLLAPVVVLAIAIGWSFPRDLVLPAVEPADKAHHYVIEGRPDTRNVGSGSFDAVELERETDGHFYAAADVDGTPIRLMVDTGASMIALSAADARKLGFQWNASELQHVGRGVNGDVMGKPVQLDSVTVGDLQADNVEAVIIPEGLDVSLLGQSFLSRVDNVQIEGDRMTLN
jgi:aspartyl protease family protein